MQQSIEIIDLNRIVKMAQINQMKRKVTLVSLLKSNDFLGEKKAPLQRRGKIF
jgi:hypothetical protein